MFTSIPSLDSVLQCLLPVFTQPSFQTHIEVLLGWVMCLCKRTEYGVFQTIQADTPISRKERHPFDRFYNFFSRSAWTVRDLAHQIAVAVVVRLNPHGLLYLVVDDTLLHKRGKNVYGLGWFRDAVASTAKRVATASGNNWVVMGLAICIPGTRQDILSSDPRHAASGGQNPQERIHVGQGNAPGHAGMVSRSKADFARRRGVFDEKLARRSRSASDLRRRHARRRGHLRSRAAETIEEPARTQVAQGTASSQSEGGREKGRLQPRRTRPVDLANGEGHGLRRDAQVARGFVSSGLAGSDGADADLGGAGARSCAASSTTSTCSPPT